MRLAQTTASLRRPGESYEKNNSHMEFKDLGLMPELERAVREAGYTTPTPIQAATIPVALAGQDVIGCAQTGTGKTAAFCLPALARAYAASSNEASLHTLILTPTRELAAQINESLATYGKHLDLWHAVIFGGVNEKPQIAELKRGVDILVATPGRLLDLMQRRLVKLDKVQLFVLDEADRMLDMGFIHDVKKVTAALPANRQTLFFSATMPAAIRKLANSLVKNAKMVAVDPVSSTIEVVSQNVYFTEKDRKRDLLVHLLGADDFRRVVVFTRTKHGSDRVARHLEKAGMKVAAIHGNKAQNARTRALDGFKSGEITVLVATDIAARGIDVDDISHVVNFELPNVPETYVHRIGRTGRAGKGGTAISLCDDEERSFLLGIERLTGKRLSVVEEHPFLPVPGRARAPSEAPSQGGEQRRNSFGSRPARGGGQGGNRKPGPSRWGSNGGGGSKAGPRASTSGGSRPQHGGDRMSAAARSR
jgi:ATP-dependent RNA helicase RhlE